ncbi:hypothetical protein GGR56DRAFT_516719 [Xylariaceae sp. FL0804]|nr:hypothetical protein GGR56DRAFT_516719 [Xylariaceae sp. FL0804]
MTTLVSLFSLPPILTLRAYGHDCVPCVPCVPLAMTACPWPCLRAHGHDCVPLAMAACPWPCLRALRALRAVRYRCRRRRCIRVCSWVARSAGGLWLGEQRYQSCHTKFGARACIAVFWPFDWF